MSYITDLVTSAWRLIRPSFNASQCLTSSETRPSQPLPITFETKKSFDLLSHKSMSRRSRVESWIIEPDSATLQHLLHNTPPLASGTTSAGRKRKRTQLLTPDSTDFKNKQQHKKRRKMADVEMMDVEMEGAFEVVEKVREVVSAGSDEEIEQEEEDDGMESIHDDDEEAEDASDGDEEDDESFESESNGESVTDLDDSYEAGDEKDFEVDDASLKEEVSDHEAGIVEDEDEVEVDDEGDEIDGDEDDANDSEEGHEDEGEEEDFEDAEEAGSDYDLVDGAEDHAVEEEEEEAGAQAELDNTTYDSAEEDISSLVAELEDANLDTIVHRTREVYSPGKLAARDTERISRLAEVADLAHAGWTGHDLTLYRAINLRGLEPLMPRDWAMDIIALPYELFTSNEDAAFIKSTRGGALGTSEMLKLLTIGGYIRSLLDRDPLLERRFRLMIKEFDNWAITDVRGMNLRRWKEKKVHTLAVITAPKFTENDVLMRRTIRKLERMEQKWKMILQGTGREVPPLYAIIHAGTVTAIMAYVPDNARHTGLDEHTKMKTIAFITTWEQREYDVWNAFALAIVIVHCRNMLMETVRGFAFHDEPVSGDDL